MANKIFTHILNFTAAKSCSIVKFAIEYPSLSSQEFNQLSYLWKKSRVSSLVIGIGTLLDCSWHKLVRQMAAWAIACNRSGRSSRTRSAPVWRGKLDSSECLGTLLRSQVRQFHFFQLSEIWAGSVQPSAVGSSLGDWLVAVQQGEQKGRC